jgi:hypothetical protein
VGLRAAAAGAVVAESALDALDVLAQGDQFLSVFARGLDEGVEQGDDGCAQDVSDALVDRGVEGACVAMGYRPPRSMALTQNARPETPAERLPELFMT